MKRPHYGQAVIETALTLPLLMAMAIGFVALLVYIEANLELSSATGLAAASAASAPPDPTVSRRYAETTFDGTLNGYAYLRNDHLDTAGCRRSLNPASSPSDYVVSCIGRATLLFRHTPVAILGFDNVALSAKATAYAPRYRSRPGGI